MLSSQFVNSGSGVPNLSGVFGKGASNLATSFQQNPPPPVHTPPPAGNLASHTTSTTNPDGTTNTTTLKYNNSVGTKPGMLNQVKGTTVSASDATPITSPTYTQATPVSTSPTVAGTPFTDANGDPGVAEYSGTTGKLLNGGMPYVPPTTTGGVFGSNVGSLTNTGQGNNNSATVNSANAGLLNIGQNGSQNVQNAQDTIQQLQNSYANGVYGIQTTPELLTTQQGQQGALQTKYGLQLGADQTALQNAINQESQQSGALSSAASSGNTQQSQNIGASATAAGLTAPQSNFPFVFDPATQTFNAPGVNGASGSTSGAPTLTYNPTIDSQTLAQEVADKKINYPDALTALGYGGKNPLAQTQLTQALIGLGINPSQIEALGIGNSSALTELATDYQTGLATLGSASKIGDTIASTLASNPSLNSQDLSGLANLNQLLSGQISSGPQQQLSQEVSQYLQTLGVDPSTAATLAFQQKGTLGELLATLYSNYQAQNEGKNPANISTPGASITNQGTGSSGIKTGTKSSDGSLTFNGTQWVKSQ